MRTNSALPERLEFHADREPPLKLGDESEGFDT